LTRLSAVGGSITCSLVAEDTKTFGSPVAVIDAIEIDARADPSPILRAFEAWCDENRVRFASCRLDHLRLKESMALEGHGFRFVEIVYRPRLTDLDRVIEPDHRIDVGEARADDLAAIEAIAHAAFTTGRLLLDWRVDPELSGRRYANWVRTSFENPAHSVIKAERDGQLVGFFVVEQRADDSVYWHLTAVAPEWQGKGIGLSLWRTMLLRHRSAGVRLVETTVSGHNPPVMNLYARLGFSFAAPQMTFHWLRDPA
jgi:ribosomal protein S18 acetylase RimI-like enzyme